MGVQHSIDETIWYIRSAISRLEDIDADIETSGNVDYEICSAIDDLNDAIKELEG